MWSEPQSPTPVDYSNSLEKKKDSGPRKMEQTSIDEMLSGPLNKQKSLVDNPSLLTDTDEVEKQINSQLM